MIDELIPLIPPHEQYLEIFAGSASLLFHKTPSKNEVINDINGDITNFFYQLKTNYDELKKMIDGSLHSEILFKKAKKMLKEKTGTDLDRAWAWWVLANMSFSHTCSTFAFGTTGCGHNTANKRDDFLRHFSDRLREVEIFNRDAIKLLKLKDNDRTWVMADCPYVSSAQGIYAGYTIEDFENLLMALSEMKGKFLLTSYPEPILFEYAKTNNWIVKQSQKTVLVSGKRDGTKIKIETMTMNYNPPQLILNLFDGHAATTVPI